MPPEENVTAKKMPFERYRPFSPLRAARRPHLADQAHREGPRWCSVDLRDGNQALIDPMDPNRKLRMFQTLVQMGFKEIEVGFLSASQPDFDFVRQLIEDDLVPDDVTIQVLVQCCPSLIERTYECLQGTSNAIVHFYNSTSVLQRDVVFGLDQAGITQIAVDAAKLAGSWSTPSRAPTSATSTARELHRYRNGLRGRDLRGRDGRDRTHHRGPADHEPPGDRGDVHPNIYADVIEWFNRTVRNRDKVCLSLHPHNDRGTENAAGPVSWPVPTGSRAPCSATASARATSTSSTWR